MANKLVISAILIALSLGANAFEYEQALEDPAQEQQAKKIFEQIRCIVCDGESLAGSNAEFSVNMRALIRKQLAEGKTEQEINNYLSERYGAGILQKPPFAPSTFLLWAAPLLFMIIGIFAIKGRKEKTS